jgi:hypothetical protein
MRLDLNIPEFTRLAWVSPEAEAVWRPRITRVSNMWIELERQAVLSGLRDGTLQVVRPEALPALSKWALSNGLTITVLGMQGSAETYGNATAPVVEGKPWDYRVFIGWGAEAHRFAAAWSEMNNLVIGEILGYPECCCEFFVKNWADENWRDLTYPMVGAAGDHHNVVGPTECNILLRWLGVRAVSHLPCSFDCDSTRRIAQRTIELGRTLGYTEEIMWLLEMLEWPVRWSSLHGVAIVTTPVVKVITSTDGLLEKVTIDRAGLNYPLEGARGLDFPFQQSNPANFYRLIDDWTENGFSSWFAMRQAHNMIVGIVPPYSGRVLDLGCGNGQLLDRLTPGDIKPCGVESDKDRHQSAARKLLKKNPELHLCDIRDFVPEGIYDVVLLSSARLEEMADSGEELLKKLAPHTKYLILYNYGNSTGNYPIPSSEFAQINSIRDNGMWASSWGSKYVLNLL